MVPDLGIIALLFVPWLDGARVDFSLQVVERRLIVECNFFLSVVSIRAWHLDN